MSGDAAPAATRRFLAALLVVYCVIEVAIAFVAPPFSGHDEVAHFAYARIVAIEHRLPTLERDTLPHDLYAYRDFSIGWDDEWRSPLYTAVHPPLYYGLMAPVFRAFQAAPPETILYALRCAAIPFGVATVVLAWLMARALYPRSLFLAITVPAVVAFQPQVSYEAAMVNNDIVAIALYSGVLYLLVRIIRDGVSWRRALVLGVVSALALLAKGTAITALVLLPAACVAARRGERWSRTLSMAALTLVPVAVLVGPWWWFMTRTYGDPMAIAALVRLQPELTRTDRTLFDFLLSGSFLMDRWAETWGEFGWRLVHIGGALPVALWCAQLAGVAGLARLALLPRTRPPAGRRRIAAMVLLAAAWALAYAGMAQFGVRFVLTQARYTFHVVDAAALLTMTGWLAWIPARRTRGVALASVAAVAVVEAVIYLGYAVPFWHGAVSHKPIVFMGCGAALLLVLGFAAAVPWPAQVSPGDEAGRPAIAGADGDTRAARPWLCAAVAAALVLFAAWRLGAFLPHETYRVADTFASFDHPFHISRAVTLLQSLRAGESLRWIGNHQAGYPAEFYPFGFAWFDVVLWGLALGRFAMPLVHKYAVIILFLSPGLLFLAMARRDRWPPIVALAAFVLHVAVPGGMWQGGYGELVYVGLVANVAAAVAAVAAMVAAIGAFESASRRALAAAGACAAAAMWCNPRSAIALAVCVGGAALVAAARHRDRVRTIVVRLAGIAGLGVLLAAPELVSLVRYRELYYFIRYTAYSDSLEYLASSIDAVSLPGFLCLLAGLAVAVTAWRRRPATAVVAVSLVAYVAATLVFSFGAGSIIEQLETTRLMPVQRLLAIYLAAVGLHAVAGWVAARLQRPRTAALAEWSAVAAVLVIYLGPWPMLSFWNRGLFEVPRSTAPSMAIFQDVLSMADAAAPPGTAVLVAGSYLSVHQQLWAPSRVQRPFFYDDWMWYWQTKHRGPYDPTSQAHYQWERLGEIFERPYLTRNGIGALVLGPEEQRIAAGSTAITRQFGGDFGLFTVNDPVPIVTFGPRHPAVLKIGNERIEASGTSGGGTALVRRNWFPRWRATVNGRPVPIRQTNDGYMEVRVPAGPVDLVLTYDLLKADIAARIAGGMGLGVLVFLVAAGGRRRGAADEAGPAVRPGTVSGGVIG